MQRLDNFYNFDTHDKYLTLHRVLQVEKSLQRYWGDSLGVIAERV